MPLGIGLKYSYHDYYDIEIYFSKFNRNQEISLEYFGTNNRLKSGLGIGFSQRITNYFNYKLFETIWKTKVNNYTNNYFGLLFGIDYLIIDKNYEYRNLIGLKTGIMLKTLKSLCIQIEDIIFKKHNFFSSKVSYRFERIEIGIEYCRILNYNEFNSKIAYKIY